jgi:crossover junction endodeoxyribonuclease RuvC
MRVLGLDPSTHTGAVVLESNKKYEISTLYAEEINFPKLKGLERCANIASVVMAVQEEYQFDFCVIEGYGFANSNTLVDLVEIGTVIRYFLWQIGINYLVVPPNSLKMFIGKGNMPKEMIRLEVFKQYGFEHPSNDVIDAFGLAMFGLACVGGKFPVKAMQACNAVLKGQPEFSKFLNKLV